MIDLHCHILPGLDDGAPDLEDAVGMALQALEDGIDTICATPHVRHDHDVAIAELPQRVAALNEELDRRGIDVRIASGAEVAESALAGLGVAELRSATLGGGGRWVLLEPDAGPLSDSLEAAVDDLGRDGLRAVIAHPERHAGSDLAERLARLMSAGALVQVTAAFLEHEQTAPVIVGLAERGLVHLLGTDAHSSRAGRPVALSGGVAALRASSRVGAHTEWITCDGPAAILAGRDVTPPF
jgi:protein-tyrosine phosphatase